MPQIGVQAMMLRDEFAAHGPFETLRKVHDLGYRCAEISQVPMTAANVAELDRARHELGFTIAALSAALVNDGMSPNDGLTEDFDKIVDDCKTLGTSMLRIGMLPIPYMADASKIFDFCDRTNEMALRLKEHGIDLYYHNHHIEFAKINGKNLLDLMAERAPALGLEIDVHWVQRGGHDPVRTLEKWAGRTAMVHLKDYRIAMMPEHIITAFEQGDRDPWMTQFFGSVEFAEVGEGNLDFPAIVPAAIASGAQYLLVEQDQFYGRTALECLKTSYDNLTTMGFGHLFESSAE